MIAARRVGRTRVAAFARGMRIAPRFRIDTAGGVAMVHIQCRPAKRIERIVLALARAPVWWHAWGELIVCGGDPVRRQIDPRPTRELRVFHVGVRWLQRARAPNVQQGPSFLARLSHLTLRPVVYNPGTG